MKAKIVLTGLLFMKKYENFLSSLKVLESSNPDFAAYKISLLSNEDIWLSMLSSRNISVHIYDSAKADELVNQIFQLYISEFNILKIKLLTFI